MLRLSLRTKIMVCCIGLVALLDLVLVAFVRRKLSRTLREECVTKGRNMAANLAARSEHFVLTDGFVSLRELVTSLKSSDEDVAYAYVTDRKGRALAHTFDGGFPADLVGVNTPRPADPWSRELLDTDEEGLVHDIAVPILKGKVGFVHVGVSEQRMRRTIAQFTSTIVVITGVVLLVAGAAVAVVSWVVTQPVRDLTEAAQRIRDGELGQRVVATTNDEIGKLVESFNQMSEELLKQHKVLGDRNRRIQMAQEQAATERDKLQAIIASMVEGVIFVDDTGRISLCNESAGRIWGTSPQRLLGRPLVECHPPHARAETEKILAEAAKRPGYAVAHTMELRKGNCISSYSSVHSEDGRYLGLVLLSLDISERLALEQEQNRLRDQLFQQEKMVLVGQIAASVAHELNTPLGTILLRSQLVRHQVADGTDLSDLDVLESEAQRCRRIVDSLLGFARRSEGTIARTDVNSLIRESLSLIENDLALKGISLETDYDGNGAIVLADSNQIQQVLLNVIANATDAMQDGGDLRIRTRALPDQDTVDIRITDTGCGMDQDVLERALDPFFTTKESGKGTGLGLAICRRIVEEHEGKIEIQSRPGRGTTVMIRLPQASIEGRGDG